LKTIIYKDANNLFVVGLSEDAISGGSVEHAASRIVPSGAEFIIVDISQLPTTPQESWRLIDGEIVSVETEESAPQVPASVTMRQARLALLGAGILDQVEAAIDALPEPPRTAARIEWDFSSEVFRERDFVLMLGDTLGLTSEQMDNLFITAATL